MVSLQINQGTLRMEPKTSDWVRIMFEALEDPHTSIP